MLFNDCLSNGPEAHNINYLSIIIIDLLIALGDDISECCIADISILLQKKDCQLCLTVESSLVEGRFLEERLEHHD